MNTGRGSNTTPQSIATAGSEIANRSNSFGEQFVLNALNGDNALAYSGDFYVASNPTPGTGLATIAAQASLADTAPFILVANLDSTRTIIFRNLMITCTVAGTNGTNFNFAAKTDNVTTRFSSAGSVITPVNPNQASGNSLASTVVQINAGAVVANAANAARLLGHLTLRTVIPVAGDSHFINFGGAEGVSASIALNGSAPTSYNWWFPPVIIGPGTTAAFHVWSASQSVAAQYEFTLAFVMR